MAETFSDKILSLINIQILVKTTDHVLWTKLACSILTKKLPGVICTYL
jgi:hypothetical protein